MGTLVTIQIVSPGGDADRSMERAFDWFAEIEARCTRFDPGSELMELTRQAGVAVKVSPIVFEAVRFAVMVAEATDGAFDPAIGGRMELEGFNREYRTGKTIDSGGLEGGVTYHDVELDPEQRSIRLRRRLTLDLGAVAKGLAVDAAARELAPFRDFAIDAGGDLYLGGRNELGKPWRVGIRHPRIPGELLGAVEVSDQAVCTSGDYERKPVGKTDGEHHILDPRGHGAARAVASATVIAGGAMLADALSTAAFVLGPEGGIEFLERMGVEGLIVTPELRQHRTRAFCYAA